MAGRPLRVIKSASVTLNASGYGFCTITCPNGVAWTIELESVSTNVANPVGTVQPRATIYHDSAPNISHYVESTYSGNRDSSNTVHRMLGGEALTAEWTGGTPGAIATFRLSGMQTEV